MHQTIEEEEKAEEDYGIPYCGKGKHYEEKTEETNKRLLSKNTELENIKA